jgi:spoIIIJ-associated protein
MPPVDPATVSVAATTFLNGLLAAASLTGSAQATVAGEDIDINVTGDEVAMFVGTKGATLMAIQDLTRVVSQRRLGDHETHLRVDIAGYREKRREPICTQSRRRCFGKWTTTRSRADELGRSQDCSRFPR